MTNYNQTLQTNNSSLEEIITQLNNLPDAGGGSMKTCTIRLVNNCVSLGAGYYRYLFTCLIDNVVTPVVHEDFVVESETVIENVICNSVFHIEFNDMSRWRLLDPQYMLYTSSIAPFALGRAPSTGGDIGILTIVEDPYA